MALSSLKKGFAGRAAAIGFGAMAAVTPLSYSFADDGRPPITSAVERQLPVAMVEDSGRAAGAYARQNPGIAVSVFLGTESSVTPQQIQTILTGDFRREGVSDPITFFFDQNDTAGTGVAYYFDNYVDGPFNLAEARGQAAETARDYAWRKERGLLASVSYQEYNQ
ncbi:hypothetical protein [uncultured Sneathiella sp.]|uniref:hypothetical protein n=1 Tax=uncultured Sneathiella sp. TaxID=879315 RepID=UPI0030EC3A2F|tara:strand:- start:16552 stop:17049 length:498 start_codon:yes stop_codon:yes gene_type:complete